MTEHQFDPATVESWQTSADHTRTLLSAWATVSDPHTPEAAAAMLELRRLIAETVGKKVAEWAVTRWLITLEPIEDCVRAELTEQRPWPSRPKEEHGDQYGRNAGTQPGPTSAPPRSLSARSPSSAPSS